MPESWTLATQEEIAQAFSLTADILEMDEETLKKQQTIYLAYMLKHPFEYEGYNANLNVFCANLGLSGMLSAKTGTDYLKLTVDAAGDITQDTEVSYTFGEPNSVKIDGVDFGAVDATMDYAGVLIKQRMLCTVKKGYALLFVMSWMDDGDLPDLEAIVDTVKFK